MGPIAPDLRGCAPSTTVQSTSGHRRIALRSCGSLARSALDHADGLAREPHPSRKPRYGTSFDVFVKCSRPLRMRAEMTLPQQQSKRPGAQPANTWMNWSWLWSEARPALAPRALCRTGVSWLQPSHLVTPSSRATVRLAGTALGIWRSAGRLTRAPRAPCRRGASLGEA